MKGRSGYSSSGSDHRKHDRRHSGNEEEGDIE